MKIHKIEIIVSDPNQEDLSASDVRTDAENTYEFGHIVKLTTKDDGKEWTDNHPLNFGAKKANNYFESLPPLNVKQ